MLILEYQCKKCFAVLEHLVDRKLVQSRLNCVYCGCDAVERLVDSKSLRNDGDCCGSSVNRSCEGCGGGCGCSSRKKQ